MKKAFFVLFLCLSSCTVMTIKTKTAGDVTLKVPVYGDKEIYYSLKQDAAGNVIEEAYGLKHQTSPQLEAGARIAEAALSRLSEGP